MKIALTSLLYFAAAVHVMADEFDAALSLPKRTENKIFRTDIRPQWLGDGERFWYRVQTGPAAYEFVLINAATS